MLHPAKTCAAAGVGAAAVIAFAITVAMPPAVEAAGFVGVSIGVPFGFPFYYPPYPYPYPYPPPMYYPAPGPYPPSAYQSSAGYASSPAPQTPSITYTPRRAWTDAAGRQCREYRTTRHTDGRATQLYGTACRDPDGQWRIVN
jgi:hypothetical protein